MIFELICQLAEQKDEKGLVELINTYKLPTLDIFDSTGIHTPTSFLASHGKMEAVNWLLKDFYTGEFKIDHEEQYDSIEEGQAVIGYAMSGYDEEVEKISDNWCITLFYYIQGCAMGGWVDKVNQKLIGGCHASREYAIIGYGLVGNVEQLHLLNSSAEEAQKKVAIENKYKIMIGQFSIFNKSQLTAQNEMPSSALDMPSL